MIIVEHAESCRIAVEMCANIISHARARAYHQSDSDRGRGGEMFPSGEWEFRRSGTKGGVSATVVEITGANTQTQRHTGVRILLRTRLAKTMGEDEITSDIIFEENESGLTDCTPSLYFFKVLIQHNLSLSLSLSLT